jgi:hypothetical protein
MSHGTHIRVTGPEDRVLYDHDGIRVTGNWVIVDGRRFDIRELEHLRTCRGPRSPLRVGAGIAAGVVLIIIALSARLLGKPGWIGAAIVLAVPLIVAAVATANSSRSYELWSEMGGYTTVVLADPNPERYRQIVRAIVRAQERLAL